MKKKIFLALTLSLMALCSSTFLVACKQDVNPYSEIKEIVEEITTNTSSYTYQAVPNTDYVGYNINGLKYKKGSTNIYVEDGEIYNTIFAISMNKIIKYYPEIENLQASKLKALETKTQEFKVVYDNFNGARERFLALEPSSNFTVYNGFYPRYKREVKKYVDKTCDLADELLNVCQTNIKYQETDDEVKNQENLEKINLINYDYQILNALGDVKEVFFVSAGGFDFDNSLFNQTKKALTSICTMAKKDNYSLTEDEKKIFDGASSAMANQRKIVRKATQNFSIYDLVLNYDNSLYAYYKSDRSKEIDYTQLNAYFGNDGYLSTYLNAINK